VFWRAIKGLIKNPAVSWGVLPYSVLMGVLQLIPAVALVAYGLAKQNKCRPYLDMLLMALPATLLYGAVMNSLPGGFFEWYFYFFAKVALFVLPGLIIIKVRGYKLSDFGLTKKKLGLSLALGSGFLIITTVVNALVFSASGPTTIFGLSWIMEWSVPLFFDAFNEEFLFRGIFFLFAYKNTGSLALSYVASMVMAFAWHPLTLVRMIPVLVQGTLMCYILYKTKNIGGAWISHGINRSLGSIAAQLL